MATEIIKVGFHKESLAGLSEIVNEIKEAFHGLQEPLEEIRDILEETFKPNPAKDFIETLADVSSIMTGILGLIVALMALGTPVAIAVGAIIALGSLLITALIENWDEISSFFIELWEGIKTTFQAAIDFILELFTNIATWINNVVIVPVGNFFIGLWSGIQNAFQTAINFITNLFTTIVTWINTNVILPIGNFFSSLWDDISNGVQTAIDFISNIFNSVVSWIDSNIIQPIGQFFSGLWDGISEGVRSMVNVVIGAMNGMIRGVLAPINLLIDGLNLLPDVNIPHLSFQIAPLASGGVVAPNSPFLALLGDNTREPEIVSPVSTMKQAFLEAMAQSSISGGGGQEIRLVMQLAGGETLADMLIDPMNRVAKNNGYSPVFAAVGMA